MSDIFKALFSNYNCNIIIESRLGDRSRELIEASGLGNRQICVVCDPDTKAALGDRIIKELGADSLVLKSKPRADMETVESIRAHKADVLVAVGSGTISDLCKYASYLDKKEYAVFATAPSMNGYFSSNASITVAGHKQTLQAHLPKGIFCDLEVLAGAPKRLIHAGLGDSICRPTAQADWLLSHLLFQTAYNSEIYTWLAPYEKDLFIHADKLVKGDRKIIELLMKTLLISGLGMVIAGGSYPASQGEHLITHTMEMKYGNTLPETYHGEQIGITSLVMAGIQQGILSKHICLVKPLRYEKEIEGYFGSISASVMQSYSVKAALFDLYEMINERLGKENTAIRDAIYEVTLPESHVAKVLEKAGAPLGAEDLGWNETQLKEATLHAKFIRNRFTFLDLL